MSTDAMTIRIHDVTKRFGSNIVLEHITLDVKRAEIFGLLGPSGAGKTTLVKMIAGIDVASSGYVDVLHERMPQLRITRSIGYMAQSDALYTDLSAKENLEFFAALYGLKGMASKQRIDEVMTLVNLTPDLNKQVSQYSGGMKRRLSLAIALLHSPEILILDEPTVGIDPVLRQSIWREIELLSQQGTTILITTHVMDEAYRCHRLGMIRDGHLIAAGPPQLLMEQTGSSTIEEAFLYYGGVHS
jgi:ABC-2 type transport system ATP-binding protein